jgi:hypothetical protein
MTTTPPSRRRPAFLDRLQPPDFRSIAAQGCFVYAYLRSACGTPYYIGIASKPNRPLGRHNCTVPKDHHRIRILRTALTWEQACYWEQHYIRRWGRQDANTGILRNRTDGGEGVLGKIISPATRIKLSDSHKGQSRPHTPEQTAKIRSALLGQKRSPEQLAKLRAASAARYISPEARAKMGDANRGKTPSPEVRAKISAAGIGRTATPETRAKISAAKKGKTFSEEHRAKLSAARKGKTATAETREKLSKAHKDKPLSPEHRAKISAAHKARRQSA